MAKKRIGEVLFSRRLTALVERPEHVCCRYRVAAFRPHLEQAGWETETRPMPRAWWRWLRLGRDLRNADAVLLLRRLIQPWQLALLRRAARCLVYDFDDAVFLRDSYTLKGLHSRRRLRRFRATVATADAVTAGNEFLRVWAGEKATLVPTCVDPDAYPLSEHHRCGTGVQLAWIGSSSTLQGLEAIRPILEGVGQSQPGLMLKLICDRFFELRHLRILPCPWSESTESAELASSDIGVSWLPNDPWSRGKCGLKVLQYMAAGLPVVANPVGVQAEIVRHGENGFLAETPAQWAEAVGRLARDPELRREMGREGRRRVESEFSVAVGARRWIALLDRLCKRQEAA